MSERVHEGARGCTRHIVWIMKDEQSCMRDATWARAHSSKVWIAEGAWRVGA